MRIAAVTALLVAVAACHGGPDANHGGGDGHPTPHGTCGASSVVTTTTCTKRTIPASNASSALGCKSDADCKDGRDGRCVKSGIPEGRFVRSPLLAGPPAQPPPTICEYDQCTTNADCGQKVRCSCGEGQSRNQCVQLDACLGDADCGPYMLCLCGGGGSPNQCLAGNCRTDADCGGATCRSSETGRFCATAADGCKSHDDCRTSSAEYRECSFDRVAESWQCRSVPPRPAG